jgi:hypothetical protein
MELELEPRVQWVTCRLFVDAVSSRVSSNLRFCSCGSGVSVSVGVGVVASGGDRHKAGARAGACFAGPKVTYCKPQLR